MAFRQGSLQTPSLQRSSLDVPPLPHLPPSCDKSDYDLYYHVNSEALRVDYQRRLRAEASRATLRSRDVSPVERIDYRYSAPRGSSRDMNWPPHVQTSNASAVSPLRSELHAVRALLQTAQLELDRLASMEEVSAQQRTMTTASSTPITSRQANHRRSTSAVDERSVGADSLPISPPSRRRRSTPHQPHTSRLEHLAQDVSSCSSCDSMPRSLCARARAPPYPQERPTARRTSAEAQEAVDTRSQSYFSVVSATASSVGSPPPSLPQSRDGAIVKAPEPSKKSASREDKRNIPRDYPQTSTTSDPPLGTQARPLLTDHTLDRYERYYRRTHSLSQAHKRLAKSRTGTPQRHPGPHPSVHVLRQIASPVPVPSPRCEARSSVTPHHRHDDEPSLLEQIQQWPQHLRLSRSHSTTTTCSNTSNTSSSGVASEDGDATPRRAALQEAVHVPLYDPLDTDSPHAAVQGDVPRTDEAARWEQGVGDLAPTARRSSVRGFTDDDAAADATYLVCLRNRIAAQRAEYLRVRDEGRLSFTSLLQSGC